MTRANGLPEFDPAGFRPHKLHGRSADWPEKNCYADLWVALLHALGLEPLAMLGHTLAVDFEGDQWTFFKPVHAELRYLYGIDVQELTVWRPLEDHAVEHLAQGKLISAEADSFWLPDTLGTDYRTAHTKTTILMVDIDTRARRLVYFHNTGCFELSGEDYERTFRIGEPPDPLFMPLFAEIVRVDRRVQRPPLELAERALGLLRRYYEWRPRTNPFTRFALRLEVDLPELRRAGLNHYHKWAFASVRQAGAAFELAGAHLKWLSHLGFPPLAEAAQAFRQVSAGNKTLLLKCARAVHTGKPFDVREFTAGMVAAWDEGMERLGANLLQRA